MTRNIIGGDDETCPDDLLTEQMRGTLNGDGAVALAAHTMRCGMCAATIETRRLLDAVIEVQVGDEALIAAVADRICAPAAAPGYRRAAAKRRTAVLRPSISARLRTALMVLGLSGGAALAGILTAGRVAERLVLPLPSSSRAAGGMVTHSVAEPSPAPSAVPSALPSPVPSERPPALSPAFAPGVATPSTLGAPPAAGMFLAANEARARGDRAAAIAWYRRLQRVHPQSEEAIISLVSLGRLLGQRDPAGAWRAFGEYLRRAPRGPLVVEALRGRAVAATALGDKVAAAVSWRELLERFPQSVYADEARARLDGKAAPLPTRR